MSCGNLCLEFTHVPAAGRGSVRCVISVPGREGTFSRLWSAPSGRLDVAQRRDLQAWVEMTVGNWYSSVIEVQETLF